MAARISIATAETGHPQVTGMLLLDGNHQEFKQTGLCQQALFGILYANIGTQLPPIPASSNMVCTLRL